MIIRGNTVGLAGRNPDYAQTDPSQSDYIFNKPDAAIQQAQQTAREALDLAKDALSRNGGTMQGAVEMGLHPISGLPQPQQESDAVNLAYLRSALGDAHFTAEVSLPAAAWSDQAPYVQTVAVEGIMATDRPHFGPVYSQEGYAGEKEAFSAVDDLETAEGSVTFLCYGERPNGDLVIQMEVNR